MSELPYASRLEELIVYQKARRLAFQVFQVTKNYPREEMYSLTDQMRRSSRSIGAQIAEAWAKRRFEKHFISKLTDADGELQETLHWIETARECGYIDNEVMEKLNDEIHGLGRMIGGMILKAGLFCGDHTHKLSEQSSEYFSSEFEDLV